MRAHKQVHFQSQRKSNMEPLKLFEGFCGQLYFFTKVRKQSASLYRYMYSRTTPGAPIFRSLRLHRSANNTYIDMNAHLGVGATERAACFYFRRVCCASCRNSFERRPRGSLPAAVAHK